MLILSCCVLSGTDATAQNLVPNAGFEVQDSCPLVSELFVAQPWESPTMGTPDAFDSNCPQQNSAARTGTGSAGFFTYSTFPDNREYIQAPLLSSLVGGQTYCVSFYVKVNNFRYGVNRVGAYFQSGAVNLSQTSVLNFTPQVENPSNNMISNTGSWTEVSGTFTASGGEDHIIIGNFADDANTDTLVINSGSSSLVSYFKIDDISVTQCVVGIEDQNPNDYFQVYPNPNNGSFTVANRHVGGQFEVRDALGRLVLSSTLSPKQNVPIINHTLAPGSYHATMLWQDGLVANTMIIIR